MDATEAEDDGARNDDDVTCNAFKVSVVLVGVPFFLEFDAGLSLPPPCATSVRVVSVSHSKL